MVLTAACPAVAGLCAVLAAKLHRAGFGADVIAVTSALSRPPSAVRGRAVVADSPVRRGRWRSAGAVGRAPDSRGAPGPAGQGDRGVPRRTRRRRQSLYAIAVFVVSVAAAACSGAPPPARHAAKPAHPRAAGTARSVAGAGNIRAQNALPGDRYWRITHPAHLYQLEGFADHADVL